MQKGQVYRNKKNNQSYCILSTGVNANNSDNNEKMVHYRKIEGDENYYRNLTEFLEKFEEVKN